jgi:hypothetical protein
MSSHLAMGYICPALSSVIQSCHEIHKFISNIITIDAYIIRTREHSQQTAANLILN